ncbi:hypothetical protein B0T26DRAFT_705629 [Lasiosphaeria miniovina]|uniref:Uncharacterized protein n=1 Tax=Lasiosphaeria miniovina TaxID=1954250 RepID=A0AA40AW78_9PEZI|nr:uncharacterized protein B0T26DRAFT_705629 [Lasiosphaeria miniovina]KAK0723160.1 hypothetical protein B0T26DRAFT_705629 [Lasiosphaeria miniovina]
MQTIADSLTFDLHSLDSLVVPMLDACLRAAPSPDMCVTERARHVIQMPCREPALKSSYIKLTMMFCIFLFLFSFIGQSTSLNRERRPGYSGLILTVYLGNAWAGDILYGLCKYALVVVYQR